jgi:hypothetical protein
VGHAAPPNSALESFLKAVWHAPEQGIVFPRLKYRILVLAERVYAIQPGARLAAQAGGE